MGSESEPAKLLLPYLQRADELQKHEPLVAYYCTDSFDQTLIAINQTPIRSLQNDSISCLDLITGRLYAMERGLKIPQKERTKTTSSILVSLLNQLEKDKKSLQLGPDDNLYIEGFASNVFAKADKQDRAGRADINTAKTFYAASIFFEILNQFGELQPDVEQKQKYAAWKAADIRKALKEGRKPEPGPPGGDEDLSIPSDTSNISYDGGSRGNVSADHSGAGLDLPPQTQDRANYQPSSPPSFSRNASSSSPSYPGNPPSSSPSYPTADDFHPVPPPGHRPETSPYSQPYHQPTYTHEHQHPPPQNYPSHEAPPPPQNYPSHEAPPPPQNYPSHEAPPPPYSYPNFQSYPNYTDQSLPSVPTHQPCYQNSDVSYSHQSAPSVSNYPSTTQYSPNGRSSPHTEPARSPAQAFHYDSNYQPPPDKIAEAHKAARFAVGALAFDDVAVAVDFLKKSLELLTNPSAGSQ
ncbi:hypothetical protein Scep_028870 [Stephania cephalantha]|uniref:Hydroxyproline-rich glycoprotein n=1 Tax=Stephania cephalantha TaxID=152367 RepID=A0AAP0HII2_9MAGN